MCSFRLLSQCHYLRSSSGLKSDYGRELLCVPCVKTTGLKCRCKKNLNSSNPGANIPPLSLAPTPRFATVGLYEVIHRDWSRAKNRKLGPQCLVFLPVIANLPSFWDQGPTVRMAENGRENFYPCWWGSENGREWPRMAENGPQNSSDRWSLFGI